jgi:hypothetical protein
MKRYFFLFLLFIVIGCQQSYFTNSDNFKSSRRIAYIVLINGNTADEISYEKMSKIFEELQWNSVYPFFTPTFFEEKKHEQFQRGDTTLFEQMKVSKHADYIALASIKYRKLNNETSSNKQTEVSSVMTINMIDVKTGKTLTKLRYNESGMHSDPEQAVKIALDNLWTTVRKRLNNLILPGQLEKN